MQIEYTKEDIVLLKKYYIEDDPKTWPFFPIIIPTKEGRGPVSDEECDKIGWEVWDQFCLASQSFNNLPEAISFAMKMNKKVFAR